MRAFDLTLPSGASSIADLIGQDYRCEQIVVQNQTGNNDIALGDSGEQVITLVADEILTLNVQNPNQLYVSGTAAEHISVLLVQ